MDNIDASFRTAARHQTARTVIICATALILAYWLIPVALAALKAGG